MKFKLSSELLIYINSFGEHVFTEVNSVSIPLLKLEAGTYDIEGIKYGSVIIRSLNQGEYYVIPAEILADMEKQPQYTVVYSDLGTVSIPETTSELTKEFERKKFETTINKATLHDLQEVVMSMYDNLEATRAAVKKMMEVGWL